MAINNTEMCVVTMKEKKEFFPKPPHLNCYTKIMVFSLSIVTFMSRFLDNNGNMGGKS